MQYPVETSSPAIWPQYEFVSSPSGHVKSSEMSIAVSAVFPASSPRQASAPRHGVGGDSSRTISCSSSTGASNAPSIGRHTETIISIVSCTERVAVSFMGVT